MLPRPLLAPGRLPGTSGALCKCSRRSYEARHPLLPPRSAPSDQVDDKRHLRYEGLPLGEQVRLTAAEAQGIRRCALFVVRTYAAAWFWTSLTTAVPALDLAFVNAFCDYPDKELLQATVPVFGRPTCGI